MLTVSVCYSRRKRTTECITNNNWKKGQTVPQSDENRDVQVRKEKGTREGAKRVKRKEKESGEEKEKGAKYIAVLVV